MLNIYCKMKIAQLNSKEEFSINKYYSNAMKNMDSADYYSKNGDPKCRICLQKASIYIFDSDKTDIIEPLQIFGNIILNKDDELKHLCKICNKFIREAILFRNTAVKADNILRQSKPMKIEETCDVAESDGDDQDCNDTYDTNQEKNSLPKKKETPKIRGTIKEKREQKGKRNCRGKTVACPICNKIYFKQYLEEHITIHEKVKPTNHVCDICGKAFRLKNSLKRHVTSHRKDFPFKCKFCPYKAKCKESVTHHTKIHTRDYKHKCTQCPAKYISKSNLNRHVLNHQPPQFKCDTCPKAFYTKAELREHNEGIHLGMKKHICNLCDKAFGFRKLMMRHQLHFHKREKMKSSRVPIYLQEEESEST